ncbi:MAG: MerR family transcriptional regulator [Rhodopirellula sp. JB044]|uniref:MerR family transcriptional regulator n=1 Tax=Rhodopirellula sp. JB044 TaxID=3342844 RepID=UPI00370B7FEB
MFSIGEFSKMTGLTVKTLRFYHEQGLLTPTHVEAGSGYRFYNESKIETARVIATLRDLDFSLADIKQILRDHHDDAEIISFLESQKDEIRERMRKDREVLRLLEKTIHHEKDATTQMQQATYQVERKSIAPQLVASVRMKGKYSDCGSGFSKIGRKFGRYISGKPMMLHHDNEYRAEDANFDAAMPIKRGESTDEITVQELPGGECLSLMHLGPYEELGRSYEKILKQSKADNIEIDMPTREIYHKGPGMIFKGNPKRYLTEIQFMIAAATDNA